MICSQKFFLEKKKKKRKKKKKKEKKKRKKKKKRKELLNVELYFIDFYFLKKKVFTRNLLF